MRSKTRGLLLVGAVLLVVGLMTGTALGQEEPVEVSGEVSGEHCGEVTIDVHHVEGGCLVEFESTEPTGIPLHAYIPQKVTLLNCLWRFTARIGENGEGYVVDGEFSDVFPGSCTRAPCDEPDHAFIPWPIHIGEHMPSTDGEELETTLCLRTIASGEGGAATQCELHLEWNELNDHDYEIGHMPSEEFCEHGPVFPVSFENVHFRYEEGSERIEVNHL